MIIQIMTILKGSIDSSDKLAPNDLARDVGRLSENSMTLPLRRAIRDLLELGQNLTDAAIK